MRGAIVALVLFAGLNPSTDPTVLVSELGSDRYLKRESAEATLTLLGRSALPALRAAAESKDPEVRLRAASILSKIEATLLVQPTLIALDFDDQPVFQVIQTINRRGGMSIKLSSSETPQRITLRNAEPLPFWNAIDALCEAGPFHYFLPAVPGSDPGGAVFPIYPGVSPRVEPVCDWGPFRTALVSVHYQSEIALNPTRLIPTDQSVRSSTAQEPFDRRTDATRQFYVQGIVVAEPRLSMTQNGAVSVIEAIDDRGQSLIMQANPATRLRSSGYFGMNPSTAVQFRVDLNYPVSKSQRLKRLKGTMPVLVAARKADPLRFPLAGSIGHRFQSPDIDLTVREIKPSEARQPYTIELTLRPTSKSLSSPLNLEEDPMAARLALPQNQLEILDEQGNPIPWFPSSSLFDGEETRLTLSLLIQGDRQRPDSIAYHGMVRTSTEVPFEFRDVPIP